MGQGKPPLTMMPEVLPRPTQVDGPSASASVRGRAVARIKVLAAAGATSVIASCGYGVVDPLPSPTCLQSPKPTVTAGYITSTKDGGAPSEGSRFVEVRVVLTNASATVADVTANAHEATVIEKEIVGAEIRFVLSVSNATKSLYASVGGRCDGRQERLMVYLAFGPDSVTATADG